MDYLLFLNIFLCAGGFNGSGWCFVALVASVMEASQFL